MIAITSNKLTEESLLKSLKHLMEKEKHKSFTYKEWKYFYRWVNTATLSDDLGLSIYRARFFYDKLVKKGLIVRERVPGQYVKYSFAEYEGHYIQYKDYFTKNGYRH